MTAVAGWRRLRRLVIGPAIGLSACASLGPARDGDIVIRSTLGSVNVAHARRVLEGAGCGPPAPDDQPASLDNVRTCLEDWLFAQALAREARTLRLATTPEARGLLETRRIEALKRALEALLDAGRAPATDAQVDDFLRANANHVSPGERLRLRHVFRRVAVHAPEDERERARTELRELRQRVLGGADLGALARAHSDSETAKFDGLIAPQARGQLPPSVEAAVWALAPGELSGIVETPIGLHVFRLEERLPAEVLPPAQQRAWARLRLAHEAREMVRRRARERLVAASGAAETRALPTTPRPAPGAVALRIAEHVVTVADLERKRERLPFAARHVRTLAEMLDDEVWARLLTWQADHERDARGSATRAAAADSERDTLAELGYAAHLAHWQSELSERDLSSFYAENPERFATPERWRLRVLVLRPVPGTSPHATYERLDALARELRAGRGDLATAARELSDDPSADDGGDLGLVTPRDLADWAGTTALERVRRLGIGELSAPLALEVYREEQLARVPEGHLLVRVEAREAPRPRSFAEARADVASAFADEHAAAARRAIRRQVLDEIHAELHPEHIVPRGAPPVGTKP